MGDRLRALSFLFAAIVSAPVAVEAVPVTRCGTADAVPREERPAFRPGELIETEHFQLHYATGGLDVIAGWPDPSFRDSLAVYLETAYRTFRDDPRLALREPLGDGPVGSAGRPLIRVYVAWMDEYYGAAHLSPVIGETCPGANRGWFELNNHFDGAELYRQARLTSAHELFHLVQATAKSYVRFFDESTANWSELHVWPQDHGSIGEWEVFRSPYLPLWDETDTRHYGAAIFWYFLDRVITTTSGRYPAAEIVWRTCDGSWFPALGDVAAEAGTDRDRLYHEFAVWNYYTNEADDGKHYDHGDEFTQTVRVQGSHTTYPVVDHSVVPAVLADWSGSNYLRFWGRASRELLRVVISGDPRVERRVTPIGTVVPNTHVQLPTVTSDADGRVELTVDDWNLYDLVTVVLTNPDSVVDGGIPTLDYTYSAEEEGASVVDLPWNPESVPLAFAPNPAAAGTFVRFDVKDGLSATTLDVFDVAGRRVRRVVDGSLAAGTHNRVWDGRDDAGRTAGNGTYLLVLRNGTNRIVKKLTVLR